MTTPYLVSGTVYNSSGNNVADVLIKFSSATGNKAVMSQSNGTYLIDLAEIGYTSGEIISYVAVDKFNNQRYSGSFTHSGESKSLNISLSERESALTPTGNRDVIVNTIGGKPVSLENPLPIIQSSIPMGDGQFTLSYTGSNLTGIVQVVGGDTYTLTLGYDGSNNLISVSKWVKS